MTKIVLNFKRREVGGYVNKTTGFGNMCFVLKMSEPVPHTSTWTFKSNDGTRLRYLPKCFASSCKIGKKALVLSDFFKT